MNTEQNRQWALVGCGTIAAEFAQAMAKLGKSIHGVSSRTRDKAAAFAAKYDIKNVYDKPENLFSDPIVDVVYIATPHQCHVPYIMAALQAGKHVLCEKAITLNSSELAEAIALAEKKKLVLGEAMTLYHMPLMKKLRRIASGGLFGPLRMIQVNFGSYKEYDMTNRFFNPDLAGGALLDIGVYALSFVRWFMSDTPVHIASQVKFAPTGVDEQAGIILQNSHDEMAVVSLSLHAKQPKRGVIAFDKGYIEVYEYPRACTAAAVYTKNGQREEIRAGQTEMALCYEIEDMEQAVAGKEKAMCLEYTADVMNMMTTLRSDWNLYYPDELRGKK